jgi:hypothetical protein
MSIIKINKTAKEVIIMILLVRDPPVFRNKKQQNKLSGEDVLHCWRGQILGCEYYDAYWEEVKQI